MADESQEHPTREELIEARARLTEQLGILKNPIRAQDRNPVLIAKIQGMIDEINESLADLGPRDAIIPNKSS